MQGINTTEFIIAGLVWLGTLVAAIVAVKKDVKAQAVALSDYRKESDKRFDVMDMHRSNVAIHQESMGVREIQQNFDNLREGQRVMNSRLTDHIEDDRRVQAAIYGELKEIKHTQNEEFKLIREALDDFRERIPRLPIPRIKD